MPTSLLPASAAAFAPRSSPNVVMQSRPEPWLTATLKRVNKVKRPLNNVGQHTRCLTETLSSTNALWVLCSIMLPKAPESELPKDDNPLVEALYNYQILHVEAYVVHVDMVSQNEVAFKLTPETIEALVDYHKDVYSVDTAACTWDWAEKEIQLKKLQDEFVQAANRFVFRTGVHVLEGMEDEGAGELLGGRSDDAKAAIMGLFVPLLPPPPRIVDVIQSTALLPSSTCPEDWWNSPAQHHQLPPAPVESWQVVPSSPSATSTCDSHLNLWASISMGEMHLPSPSLSLSPPLSTDSYSSADFYELPITTAAITPTLLPSMFAQCGTTACMTGFGWNDRVVDFASPYGLTM
ncbi:hypothetical protein LOZ61_003414 [Ophidiomyces ophidiicola]|nr:hypothetical protein LOZ61_003414 [Ophidiomyces ophidiicola]KAI1920523.1 hypothetical protein LOZ64_001839 [Ophidiomyces ophidiicola]KAI1924154.1 hypothetical protein LOZ60_004834 [Ophidiomyces ophidiicola]KAI2007205.1 hypothetical protein LOZ50_002680 [Ophidiomyces ophidiicola]KAI2010031.1 hypothetical protein LOZ49_003607 [Ophidiomyces ophidiicola]